jgi:hypothetical protein
MARSHVCRAPIVARHHQRDVRTAHPKSSSLVVFFEWSRFRDGARGVYRHVGVQGIEARQGKDDWVRARMCKAVIDSFLCIVGMVSTMRVID